MAAFTMTFTTLLLAELGDKTQLTAIALASRGNPLKVFAGCSVGFLLINLIAVVAGGIARSCMPIEYVKLFSAAILIASGILAFKSGEAEVLGIEGGFFQALLLTGSMEIGDKTNLATMAISALTGSPLEVLLGLVTSTIVLMGSAVTLGVQVAKRMSRRSLRLFSASIFVIAGLAILVEELL